MLTFENLELESRHISLELRAADVANPNVIYARIKSFNESAKDLVSDLLEKMPVLTAPSFGQNKLTKALKDFNYAANVQHPMYRPRGMAVSYIEYVEVLKKVQARFANLEKGLFEPIMKLCAIILTNPAEAAKIHSKDRILSGYDFKELEKLQEELQKCFDNTNSDRAPLGDLFDRVKDIESTEKAIQTLTKGLDSKKLDVFSRHVEDLSHRIGTVLREAMETEEYAPSKSVLTMLSDVTYYAAREIEFIGIHAAQLEGLKVAFERTGNEIIKIRQN